MRLSSAAPILSAAAALSLAYAAPAAAQDNFYAGKTLTIVTSTGEGGTYDFSARTLARHLAAHLPGKPNIIVQNMPGGGHMQATNYMYNTAPKDGTAIATVNQSVPTHQVLDGRGVRYDAAKFNWIGALVDRNQTFAVWNTAGVKSFEELKTKQVIAGATGEGSSGYRYPTAINNVFGTKIKVIKGYKSTDEIRVALQRGEVNAQATSLGSYVTENPEWITDKTMIFLVQIGSKRDPLIPDAPLWTELAQNEEDRAVLTLIGGAINIGRPFLAPPGMAPERVAMLRKAFDETVTSDGFKADADKQRLTVIPLTGDEVAKIVQDTVSASPKVIERAKQVMGTGE
ncbi:MAG TPA: tripartite tricarboxylate transporter substrate-binding protein [Alphaproteobacteria bacterium]|nr:tripartite tricarboxylate transporter substrate-binding protein [Alphaproteobacteria bacterium]